LVVTSKTSRGSMRSSCRSRGRGGSDHHERPALIGGLIDTLDCALLRRRRTWLGDKGGCA
jgi:hypothetical protein